MLKRSFALGALLALIANVAVAQQYRVGSIEITNPWSRATPKGAMVAGAYAVITNTGNAPDRLIGGSTDVAKRFEIHEMKTEGGIMKMRQINEGLVIPPGGAVELKPGSYHLMFVDLARPLGKGDRVKGTLVFEKAGTVPIEYPVEAIGARASGAGAQH
jgi:copper(I)-binding protein